jgi:hypothetical protein
VTEEGTSRPAVGVGVPLGRLVLLLPAIEFTVYLRFPIGREERFLAERYAIPTSNGGACPPLLDVATPGCDVGDSPATSRRGGMIRLRGRTPMRTSLLAGLCASLSITAGAAGEEGDPWEAFVEELARAGEVIDREVTPPDPITRAEGYRYLSRLIRMGLETTLEFADPSHPHLFPAATLSMQTGGNTADCVYIHGLIDGSRTYRIRGDRGTALLIELTVYSGMLGLHPDSRMIAALTEESLELESDGSYEVVLSPEEHAGNWIRTGSDSRYVFIRQYAHDWSATRSATFRIEVVSDAQPRTSPAPPHTFARGRSYGHPS